MTVGLSEHFRAWALTLLLCTHGPRYPRPLPSHHARLCQLRSALSGSRDGTPGKPDCEGLALVPAPNETG